MQDVNLFKFDYSLAYSVATGNGTEIDTGTDAGMEAGIAAVKGAGVGKELEAAASSVVAPAGQKRTAHPASFWQPTITAEAAANEAPPPRSVSPISIKVPPEQLLLRELPRPFSWLLCFPRSAINHTRLIDTSSLLHSALLTCIRSRIKRGSPVSTQFSRSRLGASTWAIFPRASGSSQKSSKNFSTQLWSARG